MANKMYTRGLTSSVMTGDGTNHQLVNLANLVSFENEAINNINDLVDHVNYLHKKLNAVHAVTRFADWVTEVHPSLVEDYKISERVIRRITDDDAQPEQCESAS